MIWILKGGIVVDRIENDLQGNHNGSKCYHAECPKNVDVAAFFTIGLLHAVVEEGGVLGEVEGRVPLRVPA